MKLLGLATAAAALALTGAQSAAAKPGDRNNELRQTLVKMMTHSGDQPPGQAKRPHDPDQGDDNASMTAIETVCTMDTPAAERSAICERPPVSPH